MSKEKNITTFLSIAGEDSQDLSVLANLSPAVSEADANWSVIGKLAHRPAVNWTKIYEAEGWLTQMARSPRGRLFAVSMDGELHSDWTGTWQVTNLECPPLHAVWAASEDTIFAVGGKGARVRITGTATDVTSSKRGQDLYAVHGTSLRHAVAAGNDGAVLRFDGTNWIEFASPTNYNLLTVHCRSETETYVAGAGGVLMRFDGMDFQHLVAPSELVITGLAWYGGALYASAGQDGVFRLGPDGLESVKKLIIQRVVTVDGLLFGWGNNFIAQFDGAGWWGGKLDISP